MRAAPSADEPTDLIWPFLLSGALAVSAMALYQVHRELGYFGLGLAASGFLLPRYAPDFRNYWLPALAALVPLSVIGAVSLAVADKGREAPTAGLVLIWAAACLSYPLLIRAASGRTATFRKPNFRSAWLVPLAFVCVPAMLLRFTWLAASPSPVDFDEALFAIEGLERANGAPLNLFASGTNGSSALYFQLVAWAQALPFEPATANRALSAGFGTLSILFTFLFLKEAYRDDVALAGAAFLTLWHFHIHFSRLGMPNIDDPLVASAALYFTIRAIHLKDLTSFTIAGLVCGLTPYAWTTARVLPIGLAAMLALALHKGPNRRSIAGGILVFSAGALIVAGPLLAWWYGHPDDFQARENRVAVYVNPPGPEESWYREQRNAGARIWDVAGGQFSRGADAVFTGPESGLHFNAKIGMFGALPSLLLLFGIAVACRRPQLPQNGAVIILLAASFIGGALLVEPPTSGARLVGIAVPGAAFIGIAATRLAAFATNEQGPRRSLALAIVVLAVTPGLFYYFGEWRTEGGFSHSNSRAAADWTEQLAPHLIGGERLLWFDAPPPDPDHPLIRLNLRDQSLVLIGQDGAVLRKSSIRGGATGGETLVVATGKRIATWWQGYPGCANEVAISTPSEVGEADPLALFRPSAACAVELLARYPVEPWSRRRTARRQRLTAGPRRYSARFKRSTAVNPWMASLKALDFGGLPQNESLLRPLPLFLRETMDLPAP